MNEKSVNGTDYTKQFELNVAPEIMNLVVCVNSILLYHAAYFIFS